MTTLELKTRIQQNLEKASDDVLQDVLDLLEKSQHQSPTEQEINEFIDKVFKEDYEVLKRLAQ